MYASTPNNTSDEIANVHRTGDKMIIEYKWRLRIVRMRRALYFRSKHIAHAYRFALMCHPMVTVRDLLCAVLLGNPCNAFDMLVCWFYLCKK